MWWTLNENENEKKEIKQHTINKKKNNSHIKEKKIETTTVRTDFVYIGARVCVSVCVLTHIWKVIGDWRVNR